MKKSIVLLVALFLLSKNIYGYAGENFRIDNQGNQPYCWAYAVANAVETQMIREGLDVPKDGFDKYYIVRNSKDKSITGALDLAYTTGLKDYDSDKLYKITTYSAIEVTPENICNALSSGSVVLIDSKCLSSDWKDGKIDNDDTLEVTTLHATYLYGVDKDNNASGVNSWGRKWGNDGKFVMAHDWLKFPNILGAWVIQI